MKLDHLYYFKTICKYDNLTRAAEKLGISQPALSNSVRQLELEFGIILFKRTSKGLVLTDAGKIFLAECSIVLEHIDYLKKRMVEIAAKNSAVNIKTEASISAVMLAQAVREFCSLYPNLDLNLSELRPETDIHDIIKTDIKSDIAIISTDTDSDGYGEGYNSFRLCTMPILCYVSKNHPWARLECVDYDMLKGVPLAFAEDGASHFVYNKLISLGIEPKIELITNQLSAILRQLMDGESAAVLYKGNFACVSSLVAIPFRDNAERNLDMVWAAQCEMSDSAQKFLDFIREYPFE